jgi:hypothetical protein
MRSRLGTGGGRGSETAVVEQALHYLVHAASILWRNLVIRQHKKEKRAYLSLTAFENEKLGSSVPDP